MNSGHVVEDLSMRLSLRAFWLPKRGNTAEEYEDAFWPHESLDVDSELFRFAVADGATETSFAGSWARLLVRAYCRDHLSEKRIRKQIPRLQRQWRSQVGTTSLPWYAEQKLDQGAHATVLGLTLHCDKASAGLRWDCIAVGDSCFFQVRESRIVASFPMINAEQFGNHPPLISSVDFVEDDGSKLVSRCRGAWEHRDCFYLMTDAIACWFFRACERGEEAATVLESFEDPEEFEKWIGVLRDSGEMRNDDVTVLRIRSPRG